jgi:hypothetical protein
VPRQHQPFPARGGSVAGRAAQQLEGGAGRPEEQHPVSGRAGHKPVSTPSNVYEVSTTPKPIANVVGLTEDAAFTKVGYPDSKSDLGQGRIKYTYAPGSQIRSLVAKDGKVISVER